ncbi:MAG: DNA alkylation repair protein [Candidatus Thermoplasmatota archaeon]
MRPSSVKATVARLEQQLAEQGTPARAASAKAYLKSDLEFLGADIPSVRRVAVAFTKEEPEMDHLRLLAIATALWKPPVFELRALAVALLERKQKLLAAADLDALEKMTREAKTWALSDWLAIHVVGAIVRREPSELRRLDRWAKDDDFWVRRLALICQRVDFAKGEGDWPGFVRRADAMLAEKEFFVRKAIGWMLRERSKLRPEEVVAFVGPRKERMAGLTFREATRNLADGHRVALGL